MKKASIDRNDKNWLRRNLPALLVLFLAALLFLLFRLSLREDKEEGPAPLDYAEFESGIVTMVASDQGSADEASDGAYRGRQLLIVKVTSGQYEGIELKVFNDVGPLNGVPVQEGDKVSMIINSYRDGTIMATVYEYNRLPALILIVALFFLVTILIGRKTGAKSLLALVITVASLFYILFPLLLRGAPTIPSVFLVCVYVAVISFTILGGVKRKSICAALGTIAGVAFALLFALLAQSLCRVNGLRAENVEALLLLRQSGSGVELKGLLVAGIIVSALGAVMDVAMSISSALEEVHTANGELGFRALFRSGMNIGRDMVGTMTNTLILAFIGSSFTTIFYLYSMYLSCYQLYTSAYLSIEVISGISSSIGMILAIPLTAAISALWLSRDTENSSPKAPDRTKNAGKNAERMGLNRKNRGNTSPKSAKSR